MGSFNTPKSVRALDLFASSAMPQGKQRHLIALFCKLNQKLNPEAPPLNLSLEDYPYDDVKRLITTFDRKLGMCAQDPALAGKMIEDFRQAAGLLKILRRVKIGKPYTEDGGSVGFAKLAIDRCLSTLAEQIDAIQVTPHQSLEDIINSLISTELDAASAAEPIVLQQKKAAEEDLIDKPADRTGADQGGSEITTTHEWRRFFSGLVLSIEPRVLIGDKLYDPHQLYEQCDKVCWSELKLSPETTDYVSEHREGEFELPTFEFRLADLLRGIPFPPGLIPFHATRNDGSTSLKIERSIFGFFRLADFKSFSAEDKISVTYVPDAGDAKDEIQKERNAAYTFLQSRQSVDAKTIMDLPEAVRDEIMCPGDKANWPEQLRQMIIAYDFVGLDEGDLGRLQIYPDYLPLSYLRELRLGYPIHFSILISELLQLCLKPNLIVLGRYLDSSSEQFIPTPIWQYDKNKSDISLVYISSRCWQTSTVNISDDKEFFAKVAFPNEDSTDNSVLKKLAKSDRRLLGDTSKSASRSPLLRSIISKEDLSCWDDCGIDRLIYICHTANYFTQALSGGNGKVPLRTAVIAGVENLNADKGAAQLLATLLARKGEIESKRRYQITHNIHPEFCPADTLISLTRALFQEGKLSPDDLRTVFSSYVDGSFYFQEKGNRYKSRDGNTQSIGARLLRLSDEELRELCGITREDIYQILRKSPVAISEVFTDLAPSYLPTGNTSRRYLNRSHVAGYLTGAREFIKVLLEGELSKCDVTQEPQAQTAFARICASLVEIRVLAIKTRDSSLESNVDKAFGKILGIFNGIPPLIDLEIFMHLNHRGDPTARKALLRFLKQIKENPEASGSALMLTNLDSKKDRASAATELVKYWESLFKELTAKSAKKISGRDFRSYFTASVEYLSLLKRSDLLDQHLIQSLEKRAHRILCYQILHKLCRLNPPLPEFPVSTLLLNRHGKRFTEAIHFLVDIGIIKRGNVNSKAFEDILASAQFEVEDKKDSFFIRWGNFVASLQIKIPTVPIIAHSKFGDTQPDDAQLFLRYWNRLDRSEGANRERKRIERMAGNLKKHYPNFFRKLEEKIEAGSHAADPPIKGPQYCDISKLSRRLVLAASQLQLSSLQQVSSSEDPKVGLQEHIKQLRLQANDPGSDVASRFSTLLIATGDLNWAKRVERALEILLSGKAAPLFNDVCGGRLYPSDVVERSLRALLSAEVKISDDSSLSRALNSANQPSIHLNIPKTAINSDGIGAQRRSFNRNDEFESYRPYIRGESARLIDWRKSARRDNPMVRSTEQPRAIINFMVCDLWGTEDWSSSYYYDSSLSDEIFGPLIQVINSETRLMIQSHGANLAYFSVKDSLQSYGGANHVPQAVATSSKRSSGISFAQQQSLMHRLGQAYQLSRAPSMLPFKKTAQLFQHTDQAKLNALAKASGITLFSEIDRLDDNLGALSKVAPGVRPRVILFIKDTREIDFRLFG